MPDSTQHEADQSTSEDANPVMTMKEEAVDSSPHGATEQELPVSTPGPKPPKAGANLVYRPLTASISRSRVVSVEQREDLMLSEDNQGDGGDNDDESTVTSDGESSYFAKHLPSPKSGRFPFASDAGSIGSAPARVDQTHENSSRASAASLSFSDDEDEELEGSQPISPPLVPLPKDSLQFRGIARMHSASSLVSAEDRPRPNEFDHTEAELRNLKMSRRFPDFGNRPRDNPGHAFFSRDSSESMLPSPPTILSQFPGMAHTLHPQPVNSSGREALSDDGPSARSFIDRMSISQSSTIEDDKGSHGTVTMVYSEDDDTVEIMAPTVPSSIPGGEARGVFRTLLSWSSGKPSEEDLSEPGGGCNETSDRHVESGLAAERHRVLPSVKALNERQPRSGEFRVYWQRWLMLFYMSMLNLISDWTCYSVAPIAFLTREAFGSIDPEQLVVVFLVANAVATACEPILLARLGLRRTVVFGALLLMLGSIVKSGGLAPIIASTLQKGKGEWRVYLGFFLVGLSQPLYQCTPALLSASWFPEEERTMATGVALNANQLGIGCAFAFGTLLVGSSDDIVPYFGLLSIISTIAFIGTILQFDDAPPTPPSDTAKVMRGTMEWKLPDTDALWNSVRKFGNSNEDLRQKQSGPEVSEPPSSGIGREFSATHATRRRTSSRQLKTDGFLRKHSSAGAQDRGKAKDNLRRLDPSPMIPGPVGSLVRDHETVEEVENSALYDDVDLIQSTDDNMIHPGQYSVYPFGYHALANAESPPFVGYNGLVAGHQSALPHHHFPPMIQQWTQNPQALPYGNSRLQPQFFGYYQADQYYHPYPQQYQPYFTDYDDHKISLAPPSYIEEYAEPTLTLTDHHLDINIRDDQVLLSVKACMARRGFVHALVTFTVSGIVINTLSTYMDYLVRLNGAGREYVGIVGGSFQVVIMISSLIVGQQTDKTRAYYSVTIAMLVLGAFALAECGVSLDADRGGDLRWSLIVVAALVGPLQPVSTELGVEVAFPLSENTVLVIQQLFSNLLSSMFIPFFKALRDVGTERISETELYERPQYTFSFYLLIVLHAGVTVFFATFNGRYLRYERELVRQEHEKRLSEGVEDSYEHKFEDSWSTKYRADMSNDGDYPNERQPLVTSQPSFVRR